MKKTVWSFARAHMSLGWNRQTAIRKGVESALSFALVPILPYPLYRLAKRLLVPIVSMYFNVTINRAVINHVTNKQAKKLKRAVTDEEFKEAFNKLASI